mmetsp:Transcript_38334/g.78160  ORF Transcript_38334/g.78160 Transcript_38334/m.78160 type:complete len:226 (+) Transcript_38334:1442-2119(+)
MQPLRVDSNSEYQDCHGTLNRIASHYDTFRVTFYYVRSPFTFRQQINNIRMQTWQQGPKQLQSENETTGKFARVIVLKNTSVARVVVRLLMKLLLFVSSLLRFSSCLGISSSLPFSGSFPLRIGLLLHLRHLGTFGLGIPSVGLSAITANVFHPREVINAFDSFVRLLPPFRSVRENVEVIRHQATAHHPLPTGTLKLGPDSNPVISAHSYPWSVGVNRWCRSVW